MEYKKEVIEEMGELKALVKGSLLDLHELLRHNADLMAVDNAKLDLLAYMARLKEFLRVNL